LAIQLFGPFEVRVNGAPLPRLRSRKGLWLLALLTLRHGQEVERDWLAGTLWPESGPSQALHCLRMTLTDLRRALGPAARRLQSPTSHTLSLDLAAAEVDVAAFDIALRQGDQASLERAVALYRGPLLEGCCEEWAFQERQAREQAYLAARERLAARALETGEAAEAEQHLRLAVAVDRLREGTQRALMQVLAAGGNYAAALHCYRELRERLHRELNTEPDPETKSLFQQLRGEARRLSAKGAAGQWALRERAGTHEVEEEPEARDGTGGGAADRSSSFPGCRLLVPVPSGTVAFLFTDIEGSTRLWDQEPEAMREALALHDLLVESAIGAHGGYVFKRMGDQCCVAFRTAPEALAAALAAQRALAAQPWGPTGPLKVRMALHTGAVAARDGDYFGPPLKRVARLLQAGHGDQILLSESACDLCRDHLPEGSELRCLGEHRLKDLARPERIFQFVVPGLPAEFLPLRTVSARSHNLPAQPTPLLGRERELEALGTLLRREEVRLVTLTGPGGTGKTRLGFQVAAELLDDFPDGVFFVDLAPITDPGLVTSTIAQTLGVREAGSQPLLNNLKACLREKQLLLLLDNFEQVLAAAPLVADLLAAAPRLKVLVTSRALLRLRGEKSFPVPPLTAPPAVDGQWLRVDGPAKSKTGILSGPSTMHHRLAQRAPAISQYPAVELFIQRARDAQPDFAVTNENAPAVAEICHRLDGLPLAIELAAARIRLFPPRAMLPRLGSRLKLLIAGARDLPARQQTLRSAIAWSYDLLEPAEQKLFRRLAVFVGGCSLEAAEAVGSAGGDLEIDVVDGAEALVSQHLLQQREGADGEPRFGMLETIREYGLEQLEASGEAEAIRRQHRDWYLALAEHAERGLYGENQTGWFDRLEREHDNLRAALAWTRAQGQSEEGLRLGRALKEFWYVRGYLAEGREQLAKLLALPGAEVRTAARAKALHGAGGLANRQLELGPARALLEENLALFRDLGDQGNIARALRILGEVACGRGDYEEARAFIEESLAILRELGDKDSLGLSLYYLATVAHSEGNHGAGALRGGPGDPPGGGQQALHRLDAYRPEGYSLEPERRRGGAGACGAEPGDLPVAREPAGHRSAPGSVGGCGRRAGAP
jgi:predicted ATPase/class 3 adenylate cyclase